MTRQQLLVFFLLCLMQWNASISQAQGDSVRYHLHWQTELPHIAVFGSVGLGGYAASKLNQPQGFDAVYLQTLSSASVSSFDRPATKWLSATADRASDFTSIGSTLLPLLVAITATTPSQKVGVAIISSEALLVTYGLTQIAKYSVQRARPYVYNAQAEISERINSEARLSFFSGHTSHAAASCFVAATIITDLRPELRTGIRTLVWTTAATLPAATGYLRMRAGKHFASDVITGYAVGALCGWGVPKLHLHNGKHAWRVQANPSSIGLVWNH